VLKGRKEHAGVKPAILLEKVERKKMVAKKVRGLETNYKIT